MHGENDYIVVVSINRLCMDMSKIKRQFIIRLTNRFKREDNSATQGGSTSMV